MYMAGKNEQYFVNNRIHSKHKALKGAPWTHTRIGDKVLDISGGLFNIKDNDAFLRAYYQHVFVRGNTDYLTEKQLDHGAVVIDLDLRYAKGTSERKHGEEDITFCITYYMEILRKMVDVPVDEAVKVWVMEKPNVNQLKDVTKDGVHIIIGVAMSKQLRIELRENLLEEHKKFRETDQLMGCVDHINPLEDIIDGGVAKGGNWQLYGSQKPGHEAYRLTYHYTVTGTDEFKSHDVADYVTADTLKWLSARCEDHPTYPVNPQYAEWMENRRCARVTPTYSTEKLSSPVGHIALAYADNIPLHLVDNRESWLKIVYAMRNCGLSQADAARISNKSQKFDDAAEDFLSSVWEEPMRTDDGAAGIGTLAQFSNLGDPARHQEIQTPLFKLGPPTQLCEQVKQNLADQEVAQHERSLFLPLDAIRKGALNVAKAIAPELGNDLIYSRDRWWTVNKDTNLWHSVKKPSYIVVSTIQRYLDSTMRNLNIQLANEADPEKKKLLSMELEEYCKFYQKCDSCSYLSNIFDHFTTILRDEDFIDKLDANVGYLAFENGVVDLATLTFRRGIKQNDFLTRTIPFDYFVPKEEDVKWVRSIIFKICNANEKHTDYYLSGLGYSLTGKAELEKAVYFVVGQKGNNGKSRIFEAMAKIAPCYVQNIERDTFVKGFSKAHKHLISLRGARIVYIEELPAKKLNIELLKHMGDGDVIPVEVMFGTKEEIPITCKLWALSNPTPNFQSDGGMKNRYKQLQMNSSFEPHHTEDNYEKLEFKQDPTILNKLRKEYSMAMIYLLMTYAQKYETEGMPPIPHEWKQAAEETIKTNDEFLTWFEDHCEVGEDFKAGKQEVIQSSKKELREVKDELLRHGFKYDRGLYNGGKEGRGGWKGFRLADNTSSLPAPTVNVENEQVLAAQQATADPLHVTDGNWQGAAAKSEDELDTTPN